MIARGVKRRYVIDLEDSNTVKITRLVTVFLQMGALNN